MPVKTGIQSAVDMDSRLRGNDKLGETGMAGLGHEIAAALTRLAMTGPVRQINPARGEDGSA